MKAIGETLTTKSGKVDLKAFYEKYWLYRKEMGYIHDKQNVSPRYLIILKLAGTGKDVLDVGCGEGFLSQLLAAQGNNVIGIDVSEEAIELSRKDKVEAYVCDIENENPPFVKKFDIIVMSEILEHLVSPRNALNKLKKYLSKDGFFIITFPNIAFYKYRCQLLLGRFPEQHLYDKSEHLHYWALPDFLQFLRSCNMRCDQVVPVLSFPLYRILSRLNPCVKIIEAFPNLFGQQIVVKVYPKIR